MEFIIVVALIALIICAVIASAVAKASPEAAWGIWALITFVVVAILLGEGGKSFYKSNL